MGDISGGDGSVPHLNRHVCFKGACNCQNSAYLHLRFVLLIGYKYHFERTKLQTHVVLGVRSKSPKGNYFKMHSNIRWLEEWRDE